MHRPSKSLIIKTDSYKVSHWLQYPPGTEQVYSYKESRGGLFPETVFFGLQYYLKKYLSEPVTLADIDYAEKRFAMHFGDKAIFNRKGWEHIVNVHGGYLPVQIRAVPEGLVVPTRNVLMTIRNTDDRVPWVTNYIETLLLKVWYPTTVATLSREIKKVIAHEMHLTGGFGLPLEYKLHDFGYRGVEVEEGAEVGGAAHLVNFKGSDTLAANEFISEYYADVEYMASNSIPAAEHSTISAWGEMRESDAFRNMLTQFGQNKNYAAVAVVSDTYDIFKACETWGTELKAPVLQMKNGLVIRPDSGIPHVIDVQVIETLDKYFGHTVNQKGFKKLNNVAVIQGDGVTLEEIQTILSALRVRGWSADNIAFGMGGALLQQVNRDTQKFAFKASAVVVDGRVREIYKSPISDPNKRSKRGYLKLQNVDGFYTTTAMSEPGKDCLITVWENGKLLVDQHFDGIRSRAAIDPEPETPQPEQEHEFA